MLLKLFLCFCLSAQPIFANPSDGSGLTPNDSYSREILEEGLNRLETDFYELYPEWDIYSESEKWATVLALVARDPGASKALFYNAERLHKIKTGEIMLEAKEKQALESELRIVFENAFRNYMSVHTGTKQANRFMSVFVAESVKGFTALWLSFVTLWVLMQFQPQLGPGLTLTLKALGIGFLLYGVYSPFRTLKRLEKEAPKAPTGVNLAASAEESRKSNKLTATYTYAALKQISTAESHSNFCTKILEW